MGHTPVQAQDTPGFIVNHAGRGYGTEALRIVNEGVADFATIDRILKDQAGFKLGPFELFDLTALDVSHPVMESIYNQYYQEPRYRPSVITAQRLAGGIFGKKVGEGLLKKSRMQDGFVIISVNGSEVKTLDELKEILAKIKSGVVRLEGFYPEFEGSYTYPLNLSEE
jgi:3-hydroxyacyl-CoA dehydrogenase